MSEYAQQDLERAREHNGHQLPSGCYGKGRLYVCRDCRADANLIASVRAEAQEAFSAECGRFHNEGPKCVTCGRSDRDARLAAAEKLCGYLEMAVEQYKITNPDVLKTIATWKEATGK